ncbi:MAG: hypothetical protein ACFFB8_11080 [Promethearchaeota archaeon]
MKKKKIKRFEVINESSMELEVKLNHRENVGIFVFAIIVFLGTYFFLLFDIYYFNIIFREIGSTILPTFLFSIILLPLTIFFNVLLIRSLFFTIILRIDKEKNLLFLIYDYMIYKRRKIIQINEIREIYIKENKTHTTYGLKMSNFTLNIDLASGKIIRVIGSLIPTELRRLKNLMTKNINL